MTTAKMKEAFEKCYAAGKESGFDAKERSGENLSIPQHIEHAMWMTKQASEFAWSRREKAMRWLGYVQGVLAVVGLSSVEKMKRWNMPDEGGAQDDLFRVETEISLIESTDGGPQAKIVLQVLSGSDVFQIELVKGPTGAVRDFYNGKITRSDFLRLL